MTTTIWLNGEFIEANRADDEARISIFDASVQHGVGLFETMRADGGRIHRLDQHLKRIEHSSQELRLLSDLNVPLIEASLLESVERSGLDHARIRLTITGGDLNLLREGAGARPAEPTIFIVTQPGVDYPDEFFANGVRALIADGRLNPLDPTAGHKTLNYWFRLKALQDAAAKHGGEAIWLSVSNHVMSGSVSNLFLVHEGVLFTPIARGEEEKGGLPSPVLPGITRAAMLQFAEQQLGMQTRTHMLDISHLLEAEEAFLTNSSWGVLPVTSVEAKTIGTGSPGPVTQQLRDAWLREINHDD